MKPWVSLLLVSGHLGCHAAEPHSSQGAEMAERFRRLHRGSEWRRVEILQLEFVAHHPQGLARVGDRFYLSAVEVFDRERGAGRGHLFELDLRGRLLRAVTAGKGAMYHPGGIDFDGEFLWVPVAEYRPDSRSVVYRVGPGAMTAEAMFEWGDHLGALVCGGRRRLVGVSWGSRRFFDWPVPKRPVIKRGEASSERVNGSHYVDYQDGQALKGTSYALFGGVATLAAPGAGRVALGGLELVDLTTFAAVWQVPVPLWTDGGRPMTQNALHVEVQEDGLRCWFVPEDGLGRIYVYDVK